MKIILTTEDIEKLIDESYNGINNIVIPTGKDIEFILDVDGDKFSKKTIGNHNTVNPKTISTSGVVDLNIKPDFEARLAEKAALRQDITGESIIPGIKKTLEQKNHDAAQKGLMSTGRGSSRPMKKF